MHVKLRTKEKEAKTTVIKNKLFLAIFSMFMGLHLFLMGTLRIYPFVDLPNHLARATIFRFYGEPTNQFAEYYSIDTFLKSNIFHLLFCSLKIFPSVEFGDKVFYCLYVVFLPLSALLVIRKLGGNPWFSVLSFLVLYNYNVSWGFVGFTISIPFVLLLFYFLLNDLYSDRIWIKAIVTALFLLLFFIHALATLFSLLIFFLYCLHRHRDSPIRALKESIVTIPVLILMILWWSNPSHSGPSTWGFLLDYYKNEYIQTILWRTRLLYQDNFHLYDGILGKSIGLLFSLFVIVPTFLRLVSCWKYFSHAVRNSRLTLSYLFVLASLFCCLFLPNRIPGFIILNRRFSVFFLISIIILGSIISSKKLHPVRIFSICAVCLLHFVLWSGYLSDFEKENYLFTKHVFPDNSEGKKLAGLVYDFQFRGQPIYIHFPNYYIIWNQGIASTCIVDYRLGSLIRRKAGQESLPAYLGMEWVGMRNNYDGRYANMDYVLVRGQVPKAVVGYLQSFKLSKSEAEWLLFEREACTD